MAKSKEKRKKNYPKRTHKQISNSKNEEALEIGIEIGKKKITSKSNKVLSKYNISKIYETINFINDNNLELKKLIS